MNFGDWWASKYVLNDEIMNYEEVGMKKQTDDSVDENSCQSSRHRKRRTRTCDLVTEVRTAGDLRGTVYSVY